MGKATVEQLAAELRRGGRWTESDGRRVLDAWEQSGESGAAFARKLGIDALRLAWRRKRLGRTAVSNANTPTNSAAVVRHALVPVLGQREGEIGPEEFLAMRRRRVVADAATLFDAGFGSSERIEIGCNMHARRIARRRADDGALTTAARAETPGGRKG